MPINITAVFYRYMSFYKLTFINLDLQNEGHLDHLMPCVRKAGGMGHFGQPGIPPAYELLAAIRTEYRTQYYRTKVSNILWLI